MENLKVLRLKLELETNDDVKDVLRKYGKVKDGISREFVVPSFYTLHALHYAIQKAFGWRNNHLHHFEYPEDIFEKLTDDKFIKYSKLCGLIFRFPYSDNDFEDIYWDDDYKEGKNAKLWLKEKYSAPYFYGGKLEHYLYAKKLAKEFADNNATIKIGPTFSEYLNGKRETKDMNLSEVTCEQIYFYFDGSLYELIERAPISNYLCLKPKDDNYNKNNQIVENADKQLDANLDELNRLLSIKDNYADINELFKKTDMDALPLSNELVYKYDYGDGWIIKITCIEEYTCDKESEKLVGSNDEQVEEKLSKLIIDNCIKKANPICVAADGLSVLDDVGGIYGFCDLLRCLKGYEDTDKFDSHEDAAAWASMMGWTGHMGKPENIL